MIELLPNRSLSASDCTLGPSLGVESDAAAIIDGLLSRPGVVASAAGPAAVGGLTGQQVDVRIDPKVGLTCSDADGGGYVPLLGYFAGRDWLYNGLVAKEVARIIVLDASNGRNVAIVTSASDQATFDRHASEAADVIANLTFDTGQ